MLKHCICPIGRYEEVDSENDYLIGFVDNEPRGIINGLYFPVTASYTFNLMLFSNALDGDIVNFKLFLPKEHG